MFSIKHYFEMYFWFNYLIFSAIVSSIVILCRAQSQVDVNKLFHANPPSLSPNRAVNVQRPQTTQNADSSIIGIFDEEFKPFRGSRHDEFDWALTKVLLDICITVDAQKSYPIHSNKIGQIVFIFCEWWVRVPFSQLLTNGSESPDPRTALNVNFPKSSWLVDSFIGSMSELTGSASIGIFLTFRVTQIRGVSE